MKMDLAPFGIKLFIYLHSHILQWVKTRYDLLGYIDCGGGLGGGGGVN